MRCELVHGFINNCDLEFNYRKVPVSVLDEAPKRNLLPLCERLTVSIGNIFFCGVWHHCILYYFHWSYIYLITAVVSSLMGKLAATCYRGLKGHLVCLSVRDVILGTKGKVYSVAVVLKREGEDLNCGKRDDVKKTVTSISLC